MKTIETVYKGHPEMPFIAPEYENELLLKPISKTQMERTEDGLLPGHVIMLWRIQFGTYRTDTPHHKYFATTYGIDAQKELDWLIKEGFVGIETATQSLRHLSATILKEFLKSKGVLGLSKMKRSELDEAIKSHFTNEELENLFSLRGYVLLEKGRLILEKYPEIVDKHPKKKF